MTVDEGRVRSGAESARSIRAIPNSVSVVIRAYNEEAFIGRLLDTLESQEHACGPLEIVVVDSGSSDNTVKIAKSHRVKLIEIPKQDFNYSTALNLGIERSVGEFIAVVSAHSIPCRSDWLAKMLCHFKEERVAGVYCRQVPWPEAGWREALRVRTMFRDQTVFYSQSNANGDVPLSNAASCIRRAVWENHPFVVMPAAEDREWGSWAVANGHQVVYEASSCVFHSHNESSRHLARRLIALEKAADIASGRSRNALLTTRQAVGRTCRDVREVMRLKDLKSSRLRLLWDCITLAYWFVRDFKR